MFVDPSIVFVQKIQMPVDGAKVVQPFPKRPILDAAVIVIPLTNFKQQLPVKKYNTVSLAQRHAAMVHVAWSRACSVEFKDCEILSLFQYFERVTFYVIPAPEKGAAVQADLVKKSGELGVCFAGKVAKAGAAAAVDGVGKHIALPVGRHPVDFI